MSQVKKVLVTGGTGFLGSYLCERLLADGHSVTCLDNNYTGRLSNVEHLLNQKNFQFLKHDVIDPLDLEVDVIFNFACPASPVHYQKDPVYTFKTSVLGILNMLELAKKNKALILHASTSEVYGDPTVTPQSESYLGNVSTTGIRACYDEGKRAAETLICDYHRQYGVNFKIVRIFNTYGPRMQAEDGRVVSNFILQALTGQDITLYGDGMQTRSFCYADDLVDVILLMFGKDGLKGPMNIGNPNELTIKELAEQVLQLTGSKSKMVFRPLPQDDPMQRNPDISIARKELGWEPKVKLADGLKKTIAYFEDFLAKQ